MEATGKKQYIPHSEQGSQEQAQRNAKGKATSNAKSCWEQLAGAIPEDKDEIKNWYKLLSNPLLIVMGVLLLAWWFFTQKQPGGSHHEQENLQLKQEIKQLRKKYKKLKKRMRIQLANEGGMRRSAVMD